MVNKNSPTLMPELVIHKVIESTFKTVKDSYLADTTIDKSDNLLYYFFKKDENGFDVKFKTMDYYNQAVELFTIRKIEVNMGYNMEVADIPNIHILLPNETSRPLGIGADENYQEPIYIERLVGEETVTDVQPLFTQTFDTNYNLMITSPNVFEVLLIYNLLKMGFLSLHEHIELQGLRTMKIGGQDIQIQSDLVPTHIFHRNLTLSFFYEMESPRHFKELLIRNFTVTGITP